MVDRFTNLGHFIPLRESTTRSDMAFAFIYNDWTIYKLPKEIISDRNT